MTTAHQVFTTPQIGHYYQPIPYYGGKVLKYQGVATEGNREWMMSIPEMLILPEYKGDRIYADTHELLSNFNG